MVGIGVIDFRVHSGTGGGQVFDFLPGAASDDWQSAYARRVAVHVSEAAFGGIEAAIANCWPDYKAYGHFGVTQIPVAVWREIIVDISALRDGLASARTISEVNLRGLIDANASELMGVLNDDFSVARDGLMGMIDALIPVLARWCGEFEVIFIGGI
jgi:hypothetical protein